MYSRAIILTSIAGVIGGLIWVVYGSKLAFSPPGIPGISYRNAFDFGEKSGVGTILLGVGMFGIFLSLKRKKRREKIGVGLFIFGSISFSPI